MRFRVHIFEFSELQLIVGFLTIFKEGAGNILLQLADTLPIKQTHCLLHVEIL
jgi:hypothetical protein